MVSDRLTHQRSLIPRPAEHRVAPQCQRDRTKRHRKSPCPIKGGIVRTRDAVQINPARERKYPDHVRRASEIPWRHHTSGVFAPASASPKIPIICSSLNRLPFICSSPFSDGLYL